MGPPDGGRPIPIKITDWKRVSTALEKIDTPNLNSIPNDIASTDEIDFARCSYQPRQDSGRGERAEVPASSDRRKFPPDILELIRAKNAALRRASAYPTPEYRSRARALQREVKARVREFRNEMAIDDAEIAECLADSIETQCSLPSARHRSYQSHRGRGSPKPPSNLKDDLAPVSLSEVQTLVKSLNTRKARASMASTSQETTRPPCQLQTDQPPERSGQTFEKILKLALAIVLGKGLIIDEQFGFRPAHSCPQQVLRLVEYVSEGFETERSTVAVFFDVAKAFDRQTDISHLGMSALTRQDVLSEQEFLKAPPLSSATPRTQTMYRDRRRLASNSRYSRTIPRSLRK
ncbi:Probable RNA-directed DNA polymerase from transposon BS [Eumeta japonica]|uniref:Probable RNA-directed DNA polymerase from transposon BS n=1 Tax=Eumeta variegata TaxID=151549 RepID=A0A4C1W9L1_EUMVA|nr:Probable RNA-directed DNA polymerase from transposon BS [Eumeta japonica]